MIDDINLFLNSYNIESINLGNSEQFSILQIINSTRNKSVEKVNLKFSKEIEYDPLKRKLPLYFAQKELNWDPKIMLREELAISREYF